MSGQYALYRYFDAIDRLLYVGKSGDVAARNSTHIRSSQWMQFAAGSAIERYDTPEELGEAERKAIQAEGPVFNRHYNDGPLAARRLHAYLEEVGRPDLMPSRLAAMLNGSGPLTVSDPMEMLDLLRKILTADEGSHSEARLRAVAALEGYADLPRGGELDRIAELARVGRTSAYEALSLKRPRA